MKNSLWRQPYLIELTYAQNFRILQSCIKGRGLRILDVGCGTGFMSLELARRGHRVVGIDPNKALIRVARRIVKTDPYRGSYGSLTYEAADFNTWRDDPGRYDVVLFSRVLHDLAHPARIVARAHNLLRVGGRLVCLEYAYDRLDKRTAIWLYQIRRLLELTDRLSHHLPEGLEAGIDHILKEPLAGRDEHINTFEEMRIPLERFFHRTRLSWHSYHYWDIISDVSVRNHEEEKSIATIIKNVEQLLIDRGEIRSVLFCFVGTKIA